MDNLCPSFTFGLSLFCYCPLHLYWQVNILNLDCCHLYSPRLGLEVNYLLEFSIYLFPL